MNIGGKLSGIQIPNDLIVSQSDSLQNFNEEVNFASNVEIRGTLSIEDKLNHFNVAKMCELFDATSDSWVNLTINGMYTIGFCFYIDKFHELTRLFLFLLH